MTKGLFFTELFEVGELPEPAVVSLRVVEKVPPNQDMLGMLEGFKKRVLDGELNFLAVTSTCHDTGAVISGYVKDKSALRFHVLGALDDQKMSFWAKSIED